MQRGGSAPAAYIVESSYSENSWYRIWSDGWIEQGGFFLSLIDAVNNITFEISYTSPPNVLFERTRHGAGDNYVAGVQQDSVTTTGFIVKFDFFAGVQGAGNTMQNFWRAEGY